jgi:hypothetical protein
VIVYAIVDEALSPDFPLGVEIEVFFRREDAERFVEEVWSDDPELASRLQIEERRFATPTDDGGLLEVVETVSEEQRRAFIQRNLDALLDPERQVIELRFGFEGEPWTLEAIAQELDLTRERVRQLEGQGLKRVEALRNLASLDLDQESLEAPPVDATASTVRRFVYLVIDAGSSPPDEAVDVFLSREEAERFTASARYEEPARGRHLRIEERELEAGGVN